MELDEKRLGYLNRLYQLLNGDLDQSVSMFDIGAELDLDRQESQQIAEMLMGAELVEIRNLSGAIGITQKGLDAVGMISSDTPGPKPRLCDRPILDETSVKLVEDLMIQVKSRCGDLGIGFDQLSELMADLKTIDVQLLSPKPKTAIIRIALTAVRECFDNIGEKACSAKIGELLAD